LGKKRHLANASIKDIGKKDRKIEVTDISNSKGIHYIYLLILLQNILFKFKKEKVLSRRRDWTKKRGKILVNNLMICIQSIY